MRIEITVQYSLTDPSVLLQEGPESTLFNAPTTRENNPPSSTVEADLPSCNNLLVEETKIVVPREPVWTTTMNQFPENALQDDNPTNGHVYQRLTT